MNLYVVFLQSHEKALKTVQNFTSDMLEGKKTIDYKFL